MKPRLRWQRTLWGLIATGLLGLYPLAATAGSVSLTWDPNPEPDLAGYRVYIGASSRSYTQTIDVGHVTTFTVPGLLAGETYYFAVTAYDIFANESGFSTEVFAQVTDPGPPPGQATVTIRLIDPTLADVSVSPTMSSYHVRWSVDGIFTDGDDFPGSTTTAVPAGQHTLKAEVYTAAGGTLLGTGSLSVGAPAPPPPPPTTTTPPSSGGGGTVGTTTPPANSSPQVQITLSVISYKVKGLQKADLTWNGLTSTAVDIYRDGSQMITTANDGSFTDNINRRGQGIYTYRICAAGTSTCSNEVTLSTFK